MLTSQSCCGCCARSGPDQHYLWRGDAERIDPARIIIAAEIADDRRSKKFIDTCRALGIRTVAGFMIGFPEDTADSILGVLDYARKLNPTFANFNVVTPYPGTHFFRQIHDQIATFDYSKYSVYTPVLKYQQLSPEQVSGLLEKCFTSYFFRSRWLVENGPVIWPTLGRSVDTSRDNACTGRNALLWERPPIAHAGKLGRKAA